MNITEAIEILSESAYRGATTFDNRFREAEKLGIQAMKREKECRHNLPPSEWELLPGETE